MNDVKSELYYGVDLLVQLIMHRQTYNDFPPFFPRGAPSPFYFIIPVPVPELLKNPREIPAPHPRPRPR